MNKMRLIFYIDEHGNNPVKEFMESLSESANRKLTRAIAPLHEFGIGTHIREAKKLTGTSLWEIRVLGKDSLRILYTIITRDGVLLLHGFVKKKQKTPTGEIAIALKRLNDWKIRYN